MWCFGPFQVRIRNFGQGLWKLQNPKLDLTWWTPTPIKWNQNHSFLSCCLAQTLGSRRGGGSCTTTTMARTGGSGSRSIRMCLIRIPTSFEIIIIMEWKLIRDFDNVEVSSPNGNFLHGVYSCLNHSFNSTFSDYSQQCQIRVFS